HGPADVLNGLTRDLSAYQSLVPEMSGDPGTIVDIGIKDNTQPADGTETKIRIPLAADWQTYHIPLSRFTRADLGRLYVVTEFVFGGTQTQTFRVRNITFTSALTTPGTLPQFAFGGGWYSAVYFANTSSNVVSLPIRFIRDGQALHVGILDDGGAQ